MSSENVNLRKQLSSEQERWRAAERSRAKHDERRRIEMERKSDDVHALRYRYILFDRMYLLECCTQAYNVIPSRLSSFSNSRS